MSADLSLSEPSKTEPKRTLFPISTLQVDGKEGETGYKSDAQQKHTGAITQYVGGIPGNP